MYIGCKTVSRVLLAVLAMSWGAIAASSVAAAEKDETRAETEATKAAPEVPKDVLASMDLLLRFQLRSGGSAWERMTPARRRTYGLEYYDVDELLGRLGFATAASNIFAIRSDLVTIASDQLQWCGMKWEELSLAERHRILDYLLCLNDGPCSDAPTEMVRGALIAERLEAAQGTEKLTLQGGLGYSGMQ